MKYLKTFEDSIVAEYGSIKIAGKHFTDEQFMMLLGDYIRLNKSKLNIDDNSAISVHDYSIPSVNRVVVFYKDFGHKTATTLWGENFSDFMKYLEDPELYKGAKKYNL